MKRCPYCQSTCDQVKAYAEQLPDPLVPEESHVAEMDELFTFIERKKTKSTS